MVKKSLLFLAVLLMGSFGFIKAQTVDFETGDFSQHAFTNDATYAWTVVTEGSNHYAKSGNGGVESSTSALTATHDFATNGFIAFDFAAWGEGSDGYDWDKCRFYVDGNMRFDYGNHDEWESYLEVIPAGSHTFKWEYKKDTSVNPTGDYFAIDNIIFGEGSPCVAPTTLTVSGNTLVATWNGTADVYTFQYRAEGTTTWTTISNITENTTTLPTLDYGTYEAQVQADCDAGNWVSTTFTVNDPSNYNVCVILEAHDVWGDGSGYQMLLDADATAYGTIIPESGGLTSSGNAPAGLYDNFEFLIPADADGNLTTTHIVFDGEVAIMIPAGTYDWCIVNPTPGDRLWIASSQGPCPGRYDNFEFEADHTYRFLLGVYGTNDGVEMIVTGGSSSTTIGSVALTNYAAPAYNAHPNVGLTVPTGAHYSIQSATWYCNGAAMTSSDTFNDESASYYMGVVFAPESGYDFADNVNVTFNGSATAYDAANSHLNSDGTYYAQTIAYHVVNALIYDFEDSTMQGWTTIDADGDGFTWVLASEAMDYGYGHDGSVDMILSKSYDNNYGALTPDNYLVTPTKAAYNYFSFFACAQDAAWASEHFGVAVSTGGNTSASDFVMVDEWTMTSKGTRGEVKTKGTRDQGNWYEYTVDLSAYAGQEIWVAIRHFNSTDWFYLDVDDIAVSVGETYIGEDDVNFLSVYPNPATDKLVVTSEATVNEYRVYDVTGAEVMSNKVNSDTFEINVDDLAAGVYYIRIYSDGLVQSKKFVVE